MKSLVALLFIFSISSCSRKTSKLVLAPESMRTMETIIDIPDKDKEELYVLSNTWAVETFTSSDAVIEYQDKDAGRIVGKYSFEYLPDDAYARKYLFRQTILIDVKDNKIKCRITDPYKRVTYPYELKTEYSPLVSEYSVGQARKEWEILIKSLESYLKKENVW